jgi:hypothetical protein
LLCQLGQLLAEVADSTAEVSPAAPTRLVVAILEEPLALRQHSEAAAFVLRQLSAVHISAVELLPDRAVSRIITIVVHVYLRVVRRDSMDQRPAPRGHLLADPRLLFTNRAE